MSGCFGTVTVRNGEGVGQAGGKRSNDGLLHQ